MVCAMNPNCMHCDAAVALILLSSCSFFVDVSIACESFFCNGINLGYMVNNVSVVSVAFVVFIIQIWLQFAFHYAMPTSLAKIIQRSIFLVQGHMTFKLYSIASNFVFRLKLMDGLKRPWHTERNFPLNFFTLLSLHSPDGLFVSVRHLERDGAI